MYFLQSINNTNLWWLIGLAVVISTAYFILTTLSFKGYKRVKRHFAIQQSIAKNTTYRDQKKEEGRILEKGFKTRLYLQIILGLVLHINFYFIISLYFELFAWWYIYVCSGLFLTTIFLTYRAFNRIDKKNLRIEKHEQYTHEL